MNYSPYNYAPQSLIRVNGIDGAKAYQMSANSTVALFDANQDVMYIKMTDGAGFPSIRTFKFEEVVSEPIKTADFISREEFEKFKEEMLNGKHIVSEQ